MSIKKDLTINFLGVKCENPFFLSSSPVGSNYDMVAKSFDAGWAGVYYKTIGIFRPNECSPRFDISRKEGTPWIGFKNMEQISDKPLELNIEYLKKLKKDYPTKILAVSIMGENEEEWAELSRVITEAGADILELNFSCPQMTSHDMGADVGQNPDLVYKYTKAVVDNTHLPVVAKMTPNIGDMSVPALAAVKAGAKGISAINTIKSITTIDLEKMTAMPVVDGKSSVSGYSGAAVKPIGLRFINELYQNNELKSVELSGMGGIETWQDALEYILLGSRNIQVTTSVMQYGYRIVEDMISGLSYYMEERGINSLEELVGLSSKNIIPAEDLNRDFKIIPDINYELCVECGRCYVSCYDGAHQAIDWNEEERKPEINDKCVGCHLCLNVCPVMGCITPGKIEFKEGTQVRNIISKENYI